MYLAVNGRAVQPVMALLRCDKILGNTREVHHQWWVDGETRSGCSLHVTYQLVDGTCMCKS